MNCAVYLIKVKMNDKNILNNSIHESHQKQALLIKKGLSEVDNKTSLLGNSMNDFEMIRELGKGSYGTVFQVRSLADNQCYVLKRICLKHMKAKHQSSSVREVQILREL